MNKIIVPLSKPRNPLVAMTKFRKAGSHSPKRRQAARDNRRLQD
jgi:hypothetical protein